MKKVLITISLLILIPISVVYFSIYYITPPLIAKPRIQKFLDKNYSDDFKVVEVHKKYSPDLFHQPIGYSIILEDKEGLRFGNIYVQKNFTQGKWITFMGSNIEEEYQKVKQEK